MSVAVDVELLGSEERDVIRGRLPQCRPRWLRRFSGRQPAHIQVPARPCRARDAAFVGTLKSGAWAEYIGEADDD